ncbi:MAG: hypothetical protein QM597_04695 [Aeromicrobium sp.]|uniref:hypothetical protein n=1 Tax=Aeromicrobium sp. TaxID=1871063 RepID=UPI0039E5E31B
MTRRRTVILSGAAVAAAAAVGGLGTVGRLDDVARRIGIDPVSKPDEADRALLAKAAADQARLISLVGDLSGTLSNLLTEHLDALGGAPASTEPPAVDLEAARTALADAALARRDQALDAVSPDLARTLGSVAACLELAGNGVIA